MKWKILSLAIAVAAIAADALPGYGQGYVDDAFRVSKPILGGSTRTISLGGAFSSLGGDIGTLNSNPAGLGFFRKSSISVTPQWNSSDLTSTYFYNKEGSAKKSGFDFENAGIVLAHSSPDADRGLATENRLVSFAFGASYTRGNVINTNTSFSGHNNGGSFNSVLANQANTSGINNQDYGSTLGGIAFDEYLINATDKAMTNFNPVSAAGTDQSGSISERGFSDQTNLAFGANFGNVIYIGGGVNFDNLSYQRQTNFSENGYIDPAGKVDGLTYSKFTTQNGNGMNGKAGLILNFMNALHIGAYVESPTNYHMYENTDLGLWGLKSGSLVNPSVNYTDPTSGKAVAGTYDPYVSSENVFNIRTPWKFNGGASLILGRFALLTGEAEYINYSQTRYSSDNSAQDLLTNSAISAKYKAVINYKAGAELKFGPLVIRGGYAFYPSSLQNSVTDADRRILSGGFGIRSGNFFIDFGGIKDFSRSYRTLYTLEDGTGPQLKQYNTLTGGTVTIGTRF